MDTRVDLHPTELSRSHHDREGSLSFLLFEPPYMMAPHGRLTHPPWALIPVPDSGPFLQQTTARLPSSHRHRPQRPPPKTAIPASPRYAANTRLRARNRTIVLGATVFAS